MKHDRNSIYANREIPSKLLLAWILPGKIYKLPNHNKLHNTTQIKKQMQRGKGRPRTHTVDAMQLTVAGEARAVWVAGWGPALSMR